MLIDFLSEAFPLLRFMNIEIKYAERAHFFLDPLCVIEKQLLCTNFDESNCFTSATRKTNGTMLTSSRCHIFCMKQEPFQRYKTSISYGRKSNVSLLLLYNEQSMTSTKELESNSLLLLRSINNKHY